MCQKNKKYLILPSINHQRIQPYRSPQREKKVLYEHQDKNIFLKRRKIHYGLKTVKVSIHTLAVLHVLDVNY